MPIKFARMIGRALSKIPYISQQVTPIKNIIYIPKDKSLVCFVLIIFTSCGIKQLVVSIAADIPNIFVIALIILQINPQKYNITHKQVYKIL